MRFVQNSDGFLETAADENDPSAADENDPSAADENDPSASMIEGVDDVLLGVIVFFIIIALLLFIFMFRPG